MSEREIESLCAGEMGKGAAEGQRSVRKCR